MTDDRRKSDRAELRGLAWQFTALCAVVLGIVAIRIAIRTDSDQGLMSCIAVIAIGMAVMTAVQMNGVMQRMRMPNGARHPVTLVDIPVQRTAAAAKADQPPTILHCAARAHVKGEAVSVTSQYRETVHHDARTLRPAQTPKGPTMIYCPR